VSCTRLRKSEAEIGLYWHRLNSAVVLCSISIDISVLWLRVLRVFTFFRKNVMRLFVLTKK